MELSYDLYGKTVSFSSRAPSIIGDSFQLVRIIGILDHDSARAYRDPIATHISVYPTINAIDPTIPNDATKYPYIKIQYQNGDFDALGWPWIDNLSIVVHDTTNAQVDITDIDMADLPKIRDALLSVGITNFKITPV